MKKVNTLPTLLLNVPAIANKSPADVRRLLGNPASNTSSPGHEPDKEIYMGGMVEVGFKNDRAARITVRRGKDLPFDEGALRKLGLPQAKPSRRTPHGALKWDRLCGVADVTLYPGTDAPVSHCYISVVPMRERRMTRTSRGWLQLTHG